MRNPRLFVLALCVFAIAGALTEAQVLRPSAMTRVQIVGEGEVWRSSNKVEVTNISGFKRAPRLGEKVTIIPLDVDVPAIELTIRKAKRQTECDDLDGKPWWEVKLEPVTHEKYFSAAGVPNRRDDVPFDVAVIYPAVKPARQLKRETLTQSMLPDGISINTVKGAIDLTDDGTPDVLLVEYCCLTSQPGQGCEYTCGKTFRKIGRAWKLVDTSNPC